jgi:hypothetical protein
VIIPDFQVVLNSSQSPQSLRNLTAEHVNSLIKVWLFLSLLKMTPTSSGSWDCHQLFEDTIQSDADCCQMHKVRMCEGNDESEFGLF